jgi:hypothetical protein
MAAAALAGAGLTVAAPAAPARAAVPGTVSVPCDTAALAAAITAANVRGGATLVLAANCTYDIVVPATAADGLPVITGKIGLNGGPNTVIRRSAVALFRILEVAPGALLKVNNIAIRNGNTAGLGGGILNGGTLLATQDEISGNAAGNGGGLSNSAGATAQVFSTFLSKNTTTGVGGGAIINFGDLTVSGSTLDGNTAPINGGGVNTQPGGTTRISSSTVTHNTSGGLGGGLSNLGTTSLDHTVVEFNTGSSGGGIATSNTNVTLLASLVTNNTPDNCNPLNTIPGCVN